MTLAQVRALSHLLETHGDCPVSASAEGGVVIAFVEGVAVTIAPDGKRHGTRYVREAVTHGE